MPIEYKIMDPPDSLESLPTPPSASQINHLPEIPSASQINPLPTPPSASQINPLPTPPSASQINPLPTPPSASQINPLPTPIHDIDESPSCRICLNMIVKNESRVILRLLQSVIPLIDTYCICDTGSTDNTVELIQTFFDEHGIKGQIIYEGFKDFGYNRTFALNACDQIENIDYVLLLDADMFLTGSSLISDCNIQEFKTTLMNENNGAIHLLQGSDTHYYKNVRFVKPRRGCSYWGVTHEYVKTPEATKYGEIDKSVLFIRDIGDGGSKVDKFERDIRLLEKGLEDHPGNDRYTFYLANSYRDAGRTKMAIDTYKKRIKIGGWIEEVWHSYYSIGKCYKSIGDMANAIYYWMEGFQFHPPRIETLYEIIQHYRSAGKNRLAYIWYLEAHKERERHAITSDYLFLQKEVYDYKLDYELSIIGYYINDANFDLAKTSLKVISDANVEEDIVRNVLSNYKFYSPKLSGKERQDNLYDLLEKVADSVVIEDEYTPSTPSITYNPFTGVVAVVRRFVNYRIDENGGYVNRDKIRTKNVVGLLQSFRQGCTWRMMEEFVMPYDDSLDNVYVGLEDVRVQFSQDGRLLYNANRGLDHNKIAVEHGEISLGSRDLTGGCRGCRNLTTDSGILTDILSTNSKDIEKNWVLIPEPQTQNKNVIPQKAIYGWSPLVIGIIEDGETKNFRRIQSEQTPTFFKHLRGSTNGIFVGDEIWFIGHVVSYEDRRYYYHMFIALDSETLTLKRYSKLFTFEGAKVEYTLGFIIDPIICSRFIIGYSVMDCSTKYITVDKVDIDSLFI